jgi:two-component system, OmpR family, alkaline phosphatase synthesis response regulator PhoP
MPTILIIDDEPTVADLLAELLAEEGYAVVTAFNAAEGLARAADVRPDLILSDVMMPGDDGYTLARTVAADPDLRGTPVVLMSAGPRQAPTPDTPVAAFVAKPFLLDQVLDLLDRLLA